MVYDVKVTLTKRQPTAGVRFQARAEELGQKFPVVFEQVGRYLGSRGVAFEGPAFARYVPHDGAFEVEAGFLVPETVAGEGEVVAGELPETEAITTTHMGAYDTLMNAYDALQAWARQHDRRLTAGMWEFYYSGPEVPERETRTEVFWPLEPL